jgi:hypothetical protein
MFPFLLVAGVVGVGLLLAKSQASNRAPAPPNTVGYLGEQPITASQLTSDSQALRAAEIEKFTAIGAMAGALTTAAIEAIIVGVTTTTAAAAAAVAGPVGAAIAGLIIIFGQLRGTAHLVANQWVQQVQNPFGTALAAIVDEKDRGLNAGAATKQSLQLAYQSVVKLYGQYKELAENFAAQGRDQRIVIDQSYVKLDPIVAKILDDMSKQIDVAPYF